MWQEFGHATCGKCLAKSFIASSVQDYHTFATALPCMGHMLGHNMPTFGPHKADCSGSNEIFSDCSCIGIFFDGKRNKTLKFDNNSSSHSHTTEEHYTILFEPGNNYFTHIKPDNSRAECVSRSIFTQISPFSHNVCVIGADSTNFNTGNKNGIICKLKHFLNHPVHWAICQLHLNELPLRRLFVKLDGATSGAKSFTGSIGKRLTQCHLHSVKDFAPISQSTVLLVIDLNNLSNDQSYLYQIVSSIQNGSVSSDLAAKKNLEN